MGLLGKFWPWALAGVAISCGVWVSCVVQGPSWPQRAMGAGSTALRIAMRLDLPRKIYPYSLVDGGVKDASELRSRPDAIARRAYEAEKIDTRTAEPVRSLGGAFYTNYRVKNTVLWTKKPVRIPGGEPLLRCMTKDNQIVFLRQRCGNILSAGRRVPIGMGGFEPLGEHVAEPVMEADTLVAALNFPLPLAPGFEAKAEEGQQKALVGVRDPALPPVVGSPGASSGGGGGGGTGGGGGAGGGSSGSHPHAPSGTPHPVPNPQPGHLPVPFPPPGPGPTPNPGPPPTPTPPPPTPTPTPPVSVVPEPAGLGLILLAGCAWLGARSLRQFRRARTGRRAA